MLGIKVCSTTFGYRVLTVFKKIKIRRRAGLGKLPRDSEHSPSIYKALSVIPTSTGVKKEKIKFSPAK